MELEEHSGTQSRVHRDVIHSAVDFIYSNENIGLPAWEARKRSPNRNPRWKDLENVYAMRSLVLKHDVATSTLTSTKMLCLGSHLLERYCSTPLPTTSQVVESSRKHVQGWTTSRSTSTLTTLSWWTRSLMSLHHYQTWTTPYVTSCVASVPMFTRSSAMAMLYMQGRG